MMASLRDWEREIETLSGGRIVLVRVETDTVSNTLRIPSGLPGRPLVAEFLGQESFVAQLIAAHALTLNSSAFHFVLLNMARAEDWKGMEENLLAHEFGHIWLGALGYRPPSYESCLTTHAGDIVQHILIREETRRRGFDYMAFWIRNQEKWLTSMRAGNGELTLDGCGRLQLLSAWMDAALGLTSSQWSKLPEYLEFLRKRSPQLQPAADRLQSRLQGRDLWDRSLYEAALHQTLEMLAAVMW